MTPKIGKRLTEAETQKAAVLAAYIDASPHEWPKGVADIALLCHGYLDLLAELAEAKAALSGHPLWIELAEARKDGERLDWLARRTHWVDERVHLGLRAAIDAARGPR